jgi:WD40-like Beta Propeller Repeat
MLSRNGKILIALAALCAAGAVAYVAVAALSPSATTTDARPVASDVLAHSDLMVRAVDPSNPRLNGRVYEIRDGRVLRERGDLACERVYFAAGQGICMAVAASGVDYEARTFDASLQTRGTIRLGGLPSRARISADGRYGAMTVFVSGDSYLGNSGAFSTRTYLVDMASSEVLAQLEQFSVERDGRPLDAVDFNFWGVTFDPRDSDRFYATLATGGHHYLVEGSIGGRRVRVLRDGVECPSLSPDGRRIAFKSRIGDETRWRLRVLDLATLEDHPLAEQRSIDDQPEWLDDDTLVYSDGRNVYTVPADGSGEPRLLVRDATSPARLTEGI